MDKRWVCFGEVLSGMDLVDEIEEAWPTWKGMVSSLPLMHSAVAKKEV